MNPISIDLKSIIMRHFLIIVLIMLIQIQSNFAHEPVFSIGPETIFKGGIGLESEIEYDKGASEHSTGLHYEFIFGVMENFSISGKFPYILEKKISNFASSSGLGDIMLRGKYRFYKNDKLGASYKAALIGGIKFPTGDEEKKPSIGTGATDYFLGISAGYESRKWYYFATTRYRFNNKNGVIEKGDVFLYDIAFGLRPVKRSYYEYDLVFLIEFNGEYINNDMIFDFADNNSGGDIIYIGPTFLWSMRNWMIKGGIQFPIFQNLNGTQEEEDFRNVLAVELHF